MKRQCTEGGGAEGADGAPGGRGQTERRAEGADEAPGGRGRRGRKGAELLIFFFKKKISGFYIIPHANRYIKNYRERRREL